MLARIQQVITTGLVLIALAWAAYFVSNGHPMWALFGALFIVFGYALFLAAEFVVMWFVNRTDPAPRATLRQHAAAWWGEVTTAPRVFCWNQPFLSNAVPDWVESQTHSRPVVLVHGFVCNRGLWNSLMRRLKRAHVPFVAVTLEPVFGSIDHYADIIDEAVRRVERTTGQAPVVVGHSMGGLAIRAWMDAHAGDQRAHRIITIGTPHHGTYLGRFAMTPNARQMKLSSDWQRRLSAREPARRFERFTCFYGHCDNIVFPASTATLAGADNRHIAGTAHVHMAFHADVFNEVIRWAGSTGKRADAETSAGPTLAR